MPIFVHLEVWTAEVLYWALLAFRLWALADCLTRKLAAFPAVDKLSKPAWVTILVFSAGLGSLPVYDPLGPISLIATVAAAVYLADVRPAVREISGPSR